MAQLTMYNFCSSYTIPRHMTELVFNYYYPNACSTNQICECAMYRLPYQQMIVSMHSHEYGGMVNTHQEGRNEKIN
jgi:hypothetical protein